MDQRLLKHALRDMPLGKIRYYKIVTSTNDKAIHWAERGAPDLSIIVADEQSAGKGRAGRRWITRSGAALAFSLILQDATRDKIPTDQLIPRYTALGALAVCDALREEYMLEAQIKWPNDVLVNDKKLAGILVETGWMGDRVQYVILGIGVNVYKSALPPGAELLFPATSVEATLSNKISRSGSDDQNLDRIALLRSILRHYLAQRIKLSSVEIVKAWERKLAYKGEWVRVTNVLPTNETQIIEGRVVGLAADGGLKLRDERGNVIRVHTGDVTMRPFV